MAYSPERKTGSRQSDTCAGHIENSALRPNYFRSLSILLRQKVAVKMVRRSTAQHGHLSSDRTRAILNLRRTVAVEPATCRAVHIGSTSGSSVLGNGRRRAPEVGVRS